LKNLVISETNIQSLPDWLPLSLVEFDSSAKDNQAVCRLLNLKVLGIENNIPLCIDKLKHLEYLHIWIAKKIPDSITNLKNLKILVISNYDDVVTIPKDIGKLEKLIELKISSTITEMPESIGNLKQLKILKVNSIHNRTLPQSILKLNLDKNDYSNKRIFELIKKQFPRKSASPTKQKSASPTKQKSVSPKKQKTCNTNNTKYKKSPGTYICNPVTNNWVDKKTSTGKILATHYYKTIAPKDCLATKPSTDYICNKSTGRWVLKTSATGILIQKLNTLKR
jgi:hypothetical protein